MAYTHDIGANFWFEFDNAFAWSPTPDVIAAMQSAFNFRQGGGGLDGPVDQLRASVAAPTHPAPFITALAAFREGMIEVARIQLRIINQHLVEDSDVQSAFEDFAQGVLFDDRRVDGAKVHKMDGDPENWVGYHRWNAFARAMQVFGEEPARWLNLNRFIALAWSIQTEARPEDESRDNRPLSADRLNVHRAAWLSATVDILDWAFTHHRFRAPSPEEVISHISPPSTPTGYARVQQILQDATPTGSPRHRQDGVNHGRFWLKPYAEFVTLSIYNQKLIADPGADRGKRSALVKVLRGELSPFGRMPRSPLPPVPDDQIQFISDWIDVGLPEN